MRRREAGDPGAHDEHIGLDIFRKPGELGRDGDADQYGAVSVRVGVLAADG